MVHVYFQASELQGHSYRVIVTGSSHLLVECGLNKIAFNPVMFDNDQLIRYVI